MKLSISLSEKVADSLGGLVKAHNSNPSAVVESAVKFFLDLPERSRERSVRETHASKKALSSSGWRSTFWTIIAEEFNTVDFDQSRIHQSVMAPRSYDGFQVNFLLSDVRNTNPDALIVHVMESAPYTEKTRYIGETKEYRLEDSVYQAARDVALWIREHRHLLNSAAHPLPVVNRIPDYARTLCATAARDALSELRDRVTAEWSRVAGWSLVLYAMGDYSVLQANIVSNVQRPSIIVTFDERWGEEELRLALERAWLAKVDEMAEYHDRAV